ncbi:MAG: hypothetical protein AB7I30_13545 [Isosphaeraceae bacterium]
MSQTAKVRSVESIRDFKVAMNNFVEEARNALSSVEMEVRRVRDWVQRDQYSYWQSQVKRRNEQVSMARTELHRRRLSQQNSDAISDTEQKENLREAERRLAQAEEKVKIVKKWIPILEHEIAKYHSCSQPLGDCLAGSLQNSLALLERVIRSLESYLDLAPPTAPVVADERNQAAPSATVSSRPSDPPTDTPTPSGTPGPKDDPSGDGEEPSTDDQEVTPS